MGYGCVRLHVCLVTLIYANFGTNIILFYAKIVKLQTKKDICLLGTFVNAIYIFFHTLSVSRDFVSNYLIIIFKKLNTIMDEVGRGAGAQALDCKRDKL